MPESYLPASPARTLLAALSLAVTALAISCVAAAILLTWKSIVAIGSDVIQVAWLLPFLIGLHLFQLFLAGCAWRVLLPGCAPSRAAFYRLRIIRESIDSLLPVAQVGGEIVGARLLARRGLAGSQAGASVVVDVTVELLTHVGFLICGLALVAALSPAADTAKWALVTGIAGLVAAGLVLAQRLGGLRLIEDLLRRLASHWTALAALSSIEGLNDSALRIYRQRGPMLWGLGLHQVAWFLGSIETWAVLHALGVAVSPAQAFAIESLGMAARSAGFAIPGALGLQEGGFVLAAVAVGLPGEPALALSLVKRVREIAVGSIGLTLWRIGARR